MMTDNLKNDLKVSIPRRKMNQSLTFDENKSFSNSSLAGNDNHSSFSENAGSQKDIDSSPCMIPSQVHTVKVDTPVVSFSTATASSEHSLERFRTSSLKV